MPDHGHQGGDARATRHKQQWAAHIDIPDEMSANRSAEFELVTFCQLVDQIWRDLPILNPLDGKRHLIGIVRC